MHAARYASALGVAVSPTNIPYLPMKHSQAAFPPTPNSINAVMKRILETEWMGNLGGVHLCIMNVVHGGRQQRICADHLRMRPGSAASSSGMTTVFTIGAKTFDLWLVADTDRRPSDGLGYFSESVHCFGTLG